MLNQPFFQITLPLMATFVAAIWLASWSQNKRLDDIVARLTRIENLLADHDKRLTVLETSKWR
jgi:ABC-type sugar transport system permease subunit